MSDDCIPKPPREDRCEATQTAAVGVDREDVVRIRCVGRSAGDIECLDAEGNRCVVSLCANHMALLGL
jgi:hypothetical protein